MRKLGCALVLVLAGCSSPAPQTATTPPPPSTTTQTTATTTTTTTTTVPPPPPVLPQAADGTDLNACADGTCEVQVSGAAAIKLPRSSGATLTVESIGDSAAVLAFAPTATDFSAGCPGPLCTSRITVVRGKQGAVMTAQASARVTFNKVAVAVVGVVGTSAVLRITPA